MSAPFTNYKNPADGAVSEIMSAMSSLNMEADPVPKDQLQPGTIHYLSETDRWAAHSMLHLHEAFKQASQTKALLEKLYWAVAFYDSSDEGKRARSKQVFAEFADLLTPPLPPA